MWEFENGRVRASVTALLLYMSYLSAILWFGSPVGKMQNEQAKYGERTFFFI